jgi:hypothetical protein
MSQVAIEKALIEENKVRCNPPLPPDEVRNIAKSIGQYPPAVKEPKRQETVDVWSQAEGMDTFLGTETLCAEFLDDEKRVVAKESITEIFAPRGLGKSLYISFLAVKTARNGKRVLLVDRDNSRYTVKSRLLAFGADPQMPNLKVISREKCPPLTKTAAWAAFPYASYDLVIIDSLDSAAEGVGEQDSAKPSRAVAPLLDIARRDGGPAVVILGNTIKNASHSRGSGVIEDRADIVYEVRDATDFQPTGNKPWVEELPAADAGAWASKAFRRKQRETYRLAFVASKFRIGQEPEPFILEIDTKTEPWKVRDVTDDVDRQGAEARNLRAAEIVAKLQAAAEKLKAEIIRRSTAGEYPLRKRQEAEPFLRNLGLSRDAARNLLTKRDGVDWILQSHDKRETWVVGLSREEFRRHVSTSTETAKKGGTNEPECGGPVSMHTATFGNGETRINSGFSRSKNVADDQLFISTTGSPEGRQAAIGEGWKEGLA